MPKRMRLKFPKPMIWNVTATSVRLLLLLGFDFVGLGFLGSRSMSIITSCSGRSSGRGVSSSGGGFGLFDFAEAGVFDRVVVLQVQRIPVELQFALHRTK